MPDPVCAGSSVWEMQNGNWVCVQNNCSGACTGGKTCSPVIPDEILGNAELEALHQDILGILRNPKEADRVVGNCSCQ